MSKNSYAGPNVTHNSEVGWMSLMDLLAAAFHSLAHIQSSYELPPNCQRPKPKEVHIGTEYQHSP